MLCLARLIRCAIVASGTRNARAISAVVSPPTARRVSAIAEEDESVGWQHMKRRSSVSSRSAAWSSSAARASCSSGGTMLTTSASRWRRAASARTWSVTRREATWISQARGLSGTPSVGHCVAACDQGLLDRVLRGREVAEPADDDTEHLRREVAQEARCRGTSGGACAPLALLASLASRFIRDRWAARSSPAGPRSPG